MKKFLVILILILTFQTPSQADDIRDFQIEGMSIGDSLLNHYSEKEIKKSKELKILFPKSEKFYRIPFMLDGSNYDFVGIYIKKNDPNYIIYALEGSKYMDYLTCKNEKKAVVNELDNIFENKYEPQTYEQPHTFDKSNKSMNDVTEFYGKNNYVPARVICTDWSEEMGEKHSFYDLLSVYLNSKKFSEFLLKEAYD